MSIGTGLPGVGVVWAKRVGRRFAGGTFLRAGAGGGAVVLGCGAAKWAEGGVGCLVLVKTDCSLVPGLRVEVIWPSGSNCGYRVRY